MSSAKPPMPPRRIFAVSAACCVLGVAVLLVIKLWQPSNPAATVPPHAAPVPSIRPFTPSPPSTRLETQLRPVLVNALGFSKDTSWTQRLDQIRSLPADLSADEVEAMLSALVEPCPPKVSRTIHATYMHEIACILQPLQNVRGRFAQALATIARDPRQDATTRDYAMQHLRQVWSRASGDASLRDSIVSTFRDFTSLDPALASSALLSLHLLGTDPVTDPPGSPPRQSPQPQAPRSFSLPDTDIMAFLEPVFAAKATKDNIPSRLTAIRVVGDRRITAFRTPILAILKDPGEHTLVRMAAVHALGKFADPTDLKTLASLESGNPRVQDALRQALKAGEDP